MKKEGTESEISPEQLQEAVDTILGQFSYPEQMTIKHRSIDTRTKRTEFHVDDETDSGRTLVIEHRQRDDQPNIVGEPSTETEETE